MTDILSAATFSDTDERTVAKSALDAAEEQLRSLCASHAATFVSVARRGAALEAALTELLQKVSNVESQVVTAKSALEQEEDNQSSLAALSEKHRVRRRTLLQHSSLLELLELPSLMDACVRSNLYDEALSIAAFANTLERRHTEKNEVVMKVIAQVRSRQGDLRRHLLHSLKNPVTMPECLEIITAQRRLNAIDLERQSETNLERVHSAMEMTLQVDFLEARDAWLDLATPTTPGSLSGFGGTSSKISPHSSEQLLDKIERYRTRMFEIATQFNAIFRAQTNAQKISVSLLAMWVTRRIHSFLHVLRNDLGPMEDSASVRDALDACIFFAASMGRLGADFTAQLPPVFDDKMHAMVTRFWKEGASHLAETLKICREAGVASPLSSSSAITAPESGQGGESGMDANIGPMLPPRQLMALPPIGRMVNAVLAGLNELRRCLLPGIFLRLRASLNEIITEVKGILQSNERAVTTPGLRGDAVELRAKAKEMRQMMTDIAIPYIHGALETALGNEAGAREFHGKLVEVLKPPEPVEETEEVPAEQVETTEGEVSTNETKASDESETAAATIENTAVEGINDGFDEATDIPQDNSIPN